MICEDEQEKPYLREAASFWALQIVDGFILFKEFKKVYKAKKEKVHFSVNQSIRCALMLK